MAHPGGMDLETSTPLLVATRLPNSKSTAILLLSDHHQTRLNHGSGPSILKLVDEIKYLYTKAFPLIITGLLVYGKSAISILFMGKLGKEALAGGSLANGIANISGYSIISGLAMGMEGISAQACGAKQWSFMDQTLYRTIAILLSASVPISFLWLHIEPILVFCGQDPNISATASSYLTFCFPDLLFQSFINPLKIHLRTQNITLPLMLSAAFALFLHAPVTYLLVHRLDLGIRGIALATATTDFVLLATLLLYMFFSGGDQKISWKGFSAELCFQEWKPILLLAIPSCLSVCLEWWWYELMILLSGLLTNAAEVVAAMGIILQATSLVYIFPSALSFAVSTRVGNELGGNHPGRARTSSMVALWCAVLSSFIAVSLMATLKKSWGRAFTDDEAILSLTSTVLPVVGLCELGNFPQTTGCGVLRGSSRPTLGVMINLGSFYGIGLPLALILGFGYGKGLLGLWLGLFVAQIVCGLLMVLMLKGTDWTTQANRARKLIGIGEGHKNGEYIGLSKGLGGELGKRCLS